MSDRRKERFWNQLLDLIATRNVVPVVGEELLQVPEQFGMATLFHELAERVAALREIEVADELKGILAAVRQRPDFGDRCTAARHIT
jgi:hypothetical protein